MNNNKIYAEPNGSGNGTKATPCSIYKAIELVAENNKNMSNYITVELSEVNYLLKKPVILNSKHSGFYKQ